MGLTMLLTAGLAFADALPADPLGAAGLLTEGDPAGWVCASACVGERCGYICEGPTFDIPRTSKGWAAIGKRWGYVVRREVRGAAERSRITYAGYDDVLAFPLRLAVDAALARARRAATEKLPEP